jgi:hypothetical protein
MLRHRDLRVYDYTRHKRHCDVCGGECHAAIHHRGAADGLSCGRVNSGVHGDRSFFGRINWPGDSDMVVG